eukprot:1707597-Ditylum_brightwellii.AAC.1
MLWDVRHSRMARASFALNTYRHWRKLVLRGQYDLVLGKEGVTQGDPLSMILYALEVLPLIHILGILLEILPYTMRQLQERFADDSALAGYFEAIAT